MHLLKTLFIPLVCLSSTILADNCKGSSECHWKMRKELMGNLVAAISDHRIYNAGERIV
jgi:hypothetical protein